MAKGSWQMVQNLGVWEERELPWTKIPESWTEKLCTLIFIFFFERNVHFFQNFEWKKKTNSKNISQGCHFTQKNLIILQSRDFKLEGTIFRVNSSMFWPQVFQIYSIFYTKIFSHPKITSKLQNKLSDGWGGFFPHQVFFMVSNFEHS